MTKVGYLLKQEGIEKTKKEDILKILIKKFMLIPEAMQKEIMGIKDINFLDTLFDEALDSSDLVSFEKKIHRN